MKKKEFRLKYEYIELIKLLKLLGIAESGAHAKFLVEEGEVMLNGKRETRKRAKLRAGDRIRIQDWEIVIVK
jgi:ribosome-associated protein